MDGCYTNERSVADRIGLDGCSEQLIALQTEVDDLIVCINLRFPCFYLYSSLQKFFIPQLDEIIS